MKLLVFLVCCVSYALAAEQARFDGHEVLRTYPKDRSQVNKLASLREAFDFWTEPRIRGPTDIRISGAEKTTLREFLTQNGIRYEVLISNVEALVQSERLLNEKAKAKAVDFDWTSYHGVDEILEWLDDIAKTHPDIAKIHNIGLSTEGRVLKVIQIGHASNASKPAIFLDGGIHAREWIAPAIATFFVDQLLTNRSAHQEILQTVDIYILPTFNVDGYEYSRSNDRMWRKTRGDTGNANCRGVDPNRNFDHHFGGDGTSANKCSEIYKGEAAFDQPETKAMRDFIINATNVNWQIYGALHSYAQMILTPWGYTYDLPDDYTELRRLGDQAAAALTAVYGTKYDVGSVTEILSPGAGGSDDWAKGSGPFKYSYTLEVRDTGRYGFILPPAQILPTATETFEAIKVFARHLRQ